MALEIDFETESLTVQNQTNSPKISAENLTNAATPLENYAEVGVMESKNAPGKAWPRDFPKVTTLADYKTFKSHPDYNVAKGGDIDAAGRFVHDLIRKDMDDRLIAIAKKHPDAILLGIHAIEATGKNEIPQALTNLIGEKTGLEVDRNIVQSNIVGHTGAGQNVRLYNRPEFEGEVQRGRNYILIDDMVTMGGTLGEMKNYIESRGGTVVDMITFSTQSEQNSTIALTDTTKFDLEKVFGVE